MNKNMVKQDINSLENPFWFQDENLAELSETGYIWNNGNGYIFRAGYKPPVKTDVIFLLYLLMQSQRRDWTDELQITRYQIIKDCGLNINNVWYDRLEDSLKRWEMTRIEYSGSFYDGKQYQTLHFGIIDYWSIEKGSKNLKIRFSPEYLLMVKNSAFYRFLNFDQVKALRSPLATRLHELLVKTFQGRNSWEIDAVKLAEKIPMAEKYPSDIILKIKPAVNRINRSTDLKVDLQIRKKSRGEVILIFERQQPESSLHKTKQDTSNTAPLQADLPFVPQEMHTSKGTDPELQSLFKLLPRERRGQKSLQEAITKAFSRYGSEYVAWNIRYANKHAKGNYPAYLLKALKGNYGQGLREEDEIRQSAARDLSESEQQKHAERKQLQDQDARDTELAQAFLDSLVVEDRIKLEEEALATFPPFLRARIEKANRKSVSFLAVLRGMALERIKERQAAAIEAPE